MINILTNNIIRFFVLLLLQIFVLNEINLGVYLNIYLYVLFIVLLPIEIPGWLILPLGFFMGLMVDISLNTAGLHASATTFMAFARPTVLKILKPREGYEIGLVPNLFNMGFRWFVSYALILVFTHHLWLFVLEAFRLSDLFFIFLKVVTSLILNVALIVLAQLLTYSSKSK